VAEKIRDLNSKTQKTRVLQQLPRRQAATGAKLMRTLLGMPEPRVTEQTGLCDVRPPRLRPLRLRLRFGFANAARVRMPPLLPAAHRPGRGVAMRNYSLTHLGDANLIHQLAVG